MIWAIINCIMTVCFIVLVFKLYDNYLSSQALVELRKALSHVSTRPAEEIDSEHLSKLFAEAELFETDRVQVMIWSSAAVVVLSVVAFLTSVLSEIGTFQNTFMWALAYAGLIVLLVVKVPNVKLGNFLW